MWDWSVCWDLDCCLRNSIHYFFPLSEGSACELLPDLSFCSMNSVDALGMPKHLLIITFDRYFCSRCAHAAVAVTLPRIKTCSRVFIISPVPPFPALHCHEQSASFFPKHAYCVTHVSVCLELNDAIAGVISAADVEGKNPNLVWCQNRE